MLNTNNRLALTFNLESPSDELIFIDLDRLEKSQSKDPYSTQANCYLLHSRVPTVQVAPTKILQHFHIQL